MRLIGIVIATEILSSVASVVLAQCHLPPQTFSRYTNDFYFRATPSSTEGASGEVIGFELNLTIEDIHEELFLDGGALVGGYDPQLGQVLGEPVYSEAFWEAPPFFFGLREKEGIKGFVIGLPIKTSEDLRRLIGVPIRICTLYFRLRGPLEPTFL